FDGGSARFRLEAGTPPASNRESAYSFREMLCRARETLVLNKDPSYPDLQDSADARNSKPGRRARLTLPDLDALFAAMTGCFWLPAHVQQRNIRRGLLQWLNLRGIGGLKTGKDQDDKPTTKFSLSPI